ncbi:MAG: hypothetical protein E7351_02305 [Clostridiales bacterium]|nr:hypothetical protein [Clostridiales bacterium]
MTSYILGILGIVMAGIFIDIVIPTGEINKYVKSIYSIFVVAVLLSPLIQFLNKHHDFNLTFDEYKVNENLMTYIFTNRVQSQERYIETELSDEGFSNIDIIINYSIENNELHYNSCTVNLENLFIASDKQHINKYEFIKKVVGENLDLADEEIIINE